jgi:predicted deacylase
MAGCISIAVCIVIVVVAIYCLSNVLSNTNTDRVQVEHLDNISVSRSSCPYKGIKSFDAATNVVWYDYAPTNTNAAAKAPFLVFMAGTHGNEPAGSVALTGLLPAFGRAAVDYGIKIRVIPRINPWGLDHNKRENEHGVDINRAYGPTGSLSLSALWNANAAAQKDTIDVLSAAPRVKELIAAADLVVDFHEGWAWHVSTPASIGSTVTPGDSDGEIVLANRIITGLNTSIVDDSKKFMMLPGKSCDIKSTVSCHCKKSGQPYILVETTGQNDIQPLSIRVTQVQTVCHIVISTYAIGIPNIV